MSMITNLTNIFIEIILSSISNFEKVYEHEYNIELFKNYYVNLSYNKNINIVKHCFVGVEPLEDKRIFHFCCFDDFDINNKENGYIIPLVEWNKICKKYDIIFIPQINKIDDGFLFISDKLCIKNKNESYTISAQILINRYNEKFHEYFVKHINYQILCNHPDWF